MILMGEVVALRIEERKEQRGAGLFHSVFVVQNICKNMCLEDIVKYD